MTDDDRDEFNRIRDRLRSAPDADALHAVADEERGIVQRFGAGRKTKALAIIIRNLKNYTLNFVLK